MHKKIISAALLILGLVAILGSVRVLSWGVAYDMGYHAGVAHAYDENLAAIPVPRSIPKYARNDYESGFIEGYNCGPSAPSSSNFNAPYLCSSPHTPK